MPLSHTDNFQLTGDVSRGQTSQQTADQELKYFVNFTASGQLIVPASGDTFPPMSKLMGAGFYFPGTGTACVARLQMSGGISGGVTLTTLTFNSGYQSLSWLASGPSATPPLNLGSGQMFAMGITNTYLGSGQTSSGAVVLAFNN